MTALVLLGFSQASHGAPPSDVTDDFKWSLPAGFPTPVVPASNPMSPQKVALGELLFRDKRLSRNATLACASCHKPSLYFTDGVARSKGALGDLLEFNTPSLLNSAYSTSFSWIDKGFTSLEAQHAGPLTNDAPVELGLGNAQLAELSADPLLVAKLQQAFPDAYAFTQTNIVAALASYVRTLVRGGSSFDRYLFQDDETALSAEAQAGLALFNSERLNCASCHRGFLLSGPTRSARAQFPPSFYRTGVGGSRAEFRVPSLRFIKHTAPYMHDGSLGSLEEVIRFYAAGGAADPSQAATVGPKAAERMVPFELSVAETVALLAFLDSL